MLQSTLFPPLRNAASLQGQTIDDMAREWTRNQMSRWNAAWFLYQAAMIPLDFIFWKCNCARVPEWQKQLETIPELLKAIGRLVIGSTSQPGSCAPHVRSVLSTRPGAQRVAYSIVTRSKVHYFTLVGLLTYIKESVWGPFSIGKNTSQLALSRMCYARIRDIYPFTC
jgi:hypothetical protein